MSASVLRFPERAPGSSPGDLLREQARQLALAADQLDAHGPALDLDWAERARLHEARRARLERLATEEDALARGARLLAHLPASPKGAR